jgi:hypothetical protein
MTGPDSNHHLLAAFLAGDLDPAAARRWDEHLLACEQCWRAVREDRAGRHAAQLLRQHAPPGLAERVTLAVELAAAHRPSAQPQEYQGASPPRRPRPRRAGWPRRARLAGTAALAAGLVIALVMVLAPAGQHARGMPAPVAAVARYARALPPPAPGTGQSSPGQAVPVQVGRPVTVTAGGQHIVLRTWRLGRVEAVVAISRTPFPKPANANDLPGTGMAWTKRAGTLGLYCPNGRPAELVAAPVAVKQLAALAAQLPPA